MKKKMPENCETETEKKMINGFFYAQKFTLCQWKSFDFFALQTEFKSTFDTIYKISKTKRYEIEHTDKLRMHSLVTLFFEFERNKESKNE